MKKSTTTAMTEGTIWKQLLLFALPLLASNLFQQLYNSIDAIIVGNFCGSTALAAVGSLGSLIGLVINLLIGLTTGCGVIIAQAFGSRDEEELTHSIHTAMMLSIISGLAMMVIGMVLARPLLTLMQAPDDVIDLSEQYLRIYFLGSLPMMLYNAGSSILRAIGDSRHPFYYLLAGSITNILLDLLLIAVLDMGVQGAALATVLSQTVSAVLVISQLLRTHDIYRIIPKQLKIHMYLFPRILRIGLPSGFMGIMYSIPNMAIQSQINRFGSTVMAGCTACSKLESFAYMLTAAFGLAITTFIGQNIGAGRMDRVKRGTKVCLMMCFLLVMTLVAFLLIFNRPLLHIFAQDEEVIRYGATAMFCMLPAYIVYVFVEILSGVLRGAGSTFVPMVICALCICLVRIIWLAAMMPFFPSIITVYLCYPISWAIAAAALMIYYLKGKWRNFVPQN